MVSKLSWSNIIDLLRSVEHRLVLIMPAIHEEWIDAIFSAEDPGQEVEFLICIDNSDTVVRNGYGSIKSISRLRESYINVKECTDLRVNFISVDHVSYCLFMESRILEGDPIGYNAIKLSSESAALIIKQFFPDQNEPNTEEVIALPLNEEKFDAVKRSLEITPPSHPDLQRQINTYKTFFQYAEIHFEGGNLQNKTITIPNDALPFKDVELKNRMKTRFSLFDNEDTDKWSQLEKIKRKLEDIRGKYLIPCKLKRGRSILRKEDKVAFLGELNQLKKLLEEKSKSLYEDIQRAIYKSEDALSAELSLFFEINLTDELKELRDPELRNRQIKKMVQQIITNTKFPKASDLIQNMAIEEQYAEFTEEDLSNKEFLAWFKEKNLINQDTEDQLAKFEKAYKVTID